MQELCLFFSYKYNNIYIYILLLYEYSIVTDVAFSVLAELHCNAGCMRSTGERGYLRTVE